MRPARLLITGLCCGLVLTLTASPVSAQRLDEDIQRQGKSFKELFSTVITDAKSWTVRVLVDGEDAALGTIVDSQGYILTKASQIRGRVQCQLGDGKTFGADIIGVDTEYDLAMLKIPVSSLAAVSWESEEQPKLGHWLVTPTLEALPAAVGVMSVRPRKIPSDRGVLGIGVNEESGSVTITQIYPKSGADLAGMRVTDEILSVGDRVVKNVSDLTSELRGYRPGDTAVVRVRRGLQEIDRLVMLRRPPQTNLTRGSIQNRMGGSLSVRRTGFPPILQHDSVLRPEDCGGPLLNLQGRAVGINIARAGRTETYAIAYEALKPLLENLKNGKQPPLRPSKFWTSTPPPPPLPID